MRSRWMSVLFVLMAVSCIWVSSCSKKKDKVSKSGSPEVGSLKVGYLEITPNLPFFVAVEKGLFAKRGLTVEAIAFQTSNELVESLVTKRIDFTTVTALSVIQALEVATAGRVKIYQINSIPKADPTDYLLVKKESPIQKIEDLKGKKIALFPGSNFNAWAKLIFGEHFGFGDQFTTVSLPPPNHVEALAAGSVDASYCLEPTATIAVVKGVARVLDVGLVCKTSLIRFQSPAVPSSLSSPRRTPTRPRRSAK